MVITTINSLREQQRRDAIGLAKLISGDDEPSKELVAECYEFIDAEGIFDTPVDEATKEMK